MTSPEDKILQPLWIDPDNSVRVTAFDLETTVYNQGRDRIVGDFAADPFHPDNRIVMGGWMCLEGRPAVGEDATYEISEPDVETWYNPEPSDAINKQLSRDFCKAVKNSRILVAQNAAFDLHYVRGVIERELGDDSFYFELIKDTIIWDTSLGFYELTGQEVKTPSLDVMSEYYGLELKDDRIAEYWAEGIMTEDIPYKELVEYQRADVAKTMYIALMQMQEAVQRGMWNLIVASMEGRLAAIDAEYNGMVFQAREAAKKGQEIEKELEVYSERITEVFRWKLDKHPKINPGSDQQLSIILFGGEYTYKESEPIRDEGGNPTYAQKTEKQFHGEYYKNGKPKYRSVKVDDTSRPKMKKVEKTETVEGVFKVENDAWRGKDGTPKTNDDVLTRIKKQKGKPEWAYQLIDDVLKWRELDKDLNTYYKGFCSLTWPHQGKIHGKINHTVTATSRMSSSNPNCQNLTKPKKED